MINKFIDYTKSHLPLVGGIALGIIVIAVVLIAVLGGSDDAADAEWGGGITKGIPEFSGKDSSVTAGEDGSYVAAYYSSVTSEQVAEYIQKLESKLNIDLPSDKYPCSAVSGDRIITVHYNVTEMRFSVTVTAKTTTSGEEQ